MIFIHYVHSSPSCSDPGGAPRQNDRRVCAAAKGVFFKKAEMHCKGGLLINADKYTVRVEI